LIGVVFGSVTFGIGMDLSVIENLKERRLSNAFFAPLFLDFVSKL